jgi:hypothetical protein
MPPGVADKTKPRPRRRTTRHSSGDSVRDQADLKTVKCLGGRDEGTPNRPEVASIDAIDTARKKPAGGMDGQPEAGLQPILRRCNPSAA